jgi:hypothetical protein
MPEKNMPTAEQLARGVWVKTRFFQEGPYLKSVTYCVTCGNSPEVLSFQVDLRPIAKQVAKIHRRLHEIESGRPAALKNRIGGVPPSIAYPGVNGLGIPFVDDVIDTTASAGEAIVETAKKLGRSTLGRMIVDGINDLVEATTSIPVVGDFVQVTASLVPVQFVTSILKGESIDTALAKELASKAKNLKELAPYVQAVVATVPGVGTGIAAGLAASVALAQGKSITDAVIEGARAAVPGGALAQAGFDVGVNLIVKGKSLDKAALLAARNQLSEAGKKAFDVGIALTQGKKIQQAARAKSSGGGWWFRAKSGNQWIEPKSSKAAAMFLVTNAVLEAVEKGKKAEKARENVKRALRLTNATKITVSKLTPEKAKAAFAKHRGFAKKLARAIEITKKAKTNPKLLHATLEKNIGRKKLALDKIQKVAVAASTHPDPIKRAQAKKTLEVLSMVANHRARVSSLVSENQGGTPGMFVDRHGRLIKGRFVKKARTVDPGVLLTKDGVLRGDFEKVGACIPLTRPSIGCDCKPL